MTMKTVQADVHYPGWVWASCKLKWCGYGLHSAKSKKSQREAIHSTFIPVHANWRGEMGLLCFAPDILATCFDLVFHWICCFRLHLPIMTLIHLPQLGTFCFSYRRDWCYLRHEEQPLFNCSVQHGKSGENTKFTHKRKCGTGDR